MCENGHVIKHLLRGILTDSCVSTPPALPVSAGGRCLSVDSGAHCPRLLVVLPVSADALTLDADVRVPTSTLLLDGCAAHLLCEFPDAYHLTTSPGYRLRRPGEFVGRYAAHLASVVGLLVRLAASPAVSADYAARTRAVCRLADALLRDVVARYSSSGLVPTPRPLVGPAVERLAQSASGVPLRRDDLRRCLRLADDRADTFGPLHRLLYDGIGQDGGAHALWLCTEHFRLLCGGDVPANNSNKNLVDEALS